MSWCIIGHEHAVGTLRRAAATEAPAHSYLIAGPARVGKRTLARELAAALNCEAAPDERPCHRCAACRMIDHHAHPDVIVVERAEGRQTLRVEDVREARKNVALRPYQGRFKVYLFADADEMSDESANALLLVLEEPPPRVVFVLTASKPEAVPATVLSRCRVVPVHLLPIPTLAAGLQELHGADSDDTPRIARLSGGHAGWAIDALTNPAVVAARERAVDRAVDLSSGSLSQRLLLAAEACKGENDLEARKGDGEKRKDDADDRERRGGFSDRRGGFSDRRAGCLRTLDDMQVWWRDLLLVASGSSAPLVHQDRRAELERQAARRGRERIVRGLRDIEMTAGSVERNVSPQLALEALILRLN